jgi:hypothetical protein
MSNKNTQRAAVLLETGLRRMREGQIVQARQTAAPLKLPTQHKYRMNSDLVT